MSDLQSNLMKTNSNLSRQICDLKEENGILLATIEYLLQQNPYAKEPDIYFLKKKLDRSKALEDVYKCVKEDYLPLLRQLNKGIELSSLVSVIEDRFRL